MTEESPMSVDQESRAGPSPRTEAQEQEIQALLTSIQGWVNLPRIMLEERVTERNMIPVERLRFEASQLETMRLQHLAGAANGPTYMVAARVESLFFMRN